MQKMPRENLRRNRGERAECAGEVSRSRFEGLRPGFPPLGSAANLRRIFSVGKSDVTDDGVHTKGHAADLSAGNLGPTPAIRPSSPSDGQWQSYLPSVHLTCSHCLSSRLVRPCV